jgi:hypothetical protein
MLHTSALLQEVMLIFNFEVEYFGKQSCKQKSSPLLKSQFFQLICCIQPGQPHHNQIWLTSLSTHAEYSAWGVSPSHVESENLWLYRAVEKATKWSLDISKFAEEYLTASSRQNNTALKKS